MAGALEGVTILEVVRVGPAAFATMMLADMGAEVIKIETPPQAAVKGADFGTLTEKEAREAAYTLHNRNKRSIAINLKARDGQKLLHKMAARADVFVEGFRPGVMKRLGGDYETLRQINPRLVYCSLSGYGQAGPYRDFAGHDINYISLGGALNLIGEAGKLPTVPLNVIADYAGAALHGVVGILLALFAREKTGQGQFIDISYLDTVVYLAANWCAAPYFSRGKVIERGQTPYSGGYPYYAVYKAKDGKLLTIGCREPWLWANLCRALGREDFIPYATRPEHLGQAPDADYREVKRQLEEIFLTRTRDEWFDRLIKQDVCIGKVYSWDEVLADPHILYRQMLLEVPHPALGMLKQVGIPIKLSRNPGSVRRNGPYLGENTDEVMGELGYAAEAIERLRQENVIA
ncbi:MAG: CoA transferase [Chloroflexi bacterium]|nr:CoA transferase [Chloroflexota bacterium]